MPRITLLLAVLLLASRCALAAPQSQPATRPAEEEILRLVVQLGDPLSERRDQAQAALRRMGKAVLPMLREAAGAGDPEIASRAARLIKQIERPAIPGGPLDGQILRTINLRNDIAGWTIEASTTTRTFRCRQSAAGIELSVQGTENGQAVTRTYEAKSLEDMEKDAPEAYAVCRRLIRDSAVNGRGFVVVGPNAFAGQQDLLDVLKETLDLQMQRQRIAPEKRREVLDDLAQLKKFRERQGDEDDAARDKRLKRYFEGSDALRKKLDGMKLEAGDILPPPAKARLGIQCLTTVDGVNQPRLMVEAIVPDSRAAAMGLRAGDTILKANGQEIRDVMELRTVLSESKGPVQIDILRDDKPLTIKERGPAQEKKP